MKILFVASGNSGKVTPIIRNQGESLVQAGAEVEYFLIRGKGIRGYLRNVPSIRKQIRNGHYDVVHAHYSLSAFAASLAGARHMVVSLMGSDVKASKAYKWLIRIFATVFRWKTIIVKSADMYRDLGMNDAVIIPNGVNLQHFCKMDQTECREKLGWSSSVIHILFPANPSRPEKDFYLARQTVALLQDVELHAFIDVSNEQTPVYYNAADAVLLTSKWEGSPNVIKEAMACGCKIVSTDIGDVRERLSGVDGCYVADTRQPEELAELLKKALAYDGETNGRERIIADGLDSDSVAKQLLKLY